MLVGIDATHANKIHRTGVEEYCFQIIQELKKKIPSDTRVVLYSNNVLIPELAQLPNNWEVKILVWPFKKMWSQFRLAYELWRNPPDVYFSPGQLLPFFAPKNSVVMVHDSAFEAYPSVYRFFGCQYLKWMNRLVVKKAKLILTSTEFNKKELLKYYCHNVIHADCQCRSHPRSARINSSGNPVGDCNCEPKVKQSLVSKIKVIPLAYDTKKFNLEKPISQLSFRATERSRGISCIYGQYILSIGRLEEKKNTARIVQAFEIVKKQMPDLKLILVGKPGAGYEKVKQTIEQSIFKKDIILPGFVSSDDLVNILKNAQVFVFPSLYEGFGIPVLEAMAVGVPVVASKGSALDEVGGGAVEHVNPFDINDIGLKIFELINDGEYRKNKISLGLEQVKKYSWDETARLTWETIKQ